MYCAREHVDFILTDVVMNDGSNGLDVAAKLKETYPSIKIIIMTSMPDAAFLERARNIGVDSFWYKEIADPNGPAFFVYTYHYWGCAERTKYVECFLMIKICIT